MFEFCKTLKSYKTQIFLKPLYEYEYAYSPYSSPYICYGTSKGNLSKYQDINFFMITFFILITWMFEQVVTM